MNHRDRELAAIRHETPDRIPVDAICIENTAAVAAHLGIAEADVLSHLGLDGRAVGIVYAGDTQEPTGDDSRNEWGALTGAEYGTAHEYPLAGAQNVADIDSHAWPCPALYDYAAASAADLMLYGDYYPLTPFHRSAEKWVVRQFDCPETGRGFVQGIRLPAAPEEAITVHPKGINPDAVCRFENAESGETKEMSGAALRDEGFTFTLAPRSGAIWFYAQNLT